MQLLLDNVLKNEAIQLKNEIVCLTSNMVIIVGLPEVNYQNVIMATFTSNGDFILSMVPIGVHLILLRTNIKFSN